MRIGGGPNQIQSVQPGKGETPPPGKTLPEKVQPTNATGPVIMGPADAAVDLFDDGGLGGKKLDELLALLQKRQQEHSQLVELAKDLGEELKKLRLRYRNQCKAAKEFDQGAKGNKSVEGPFPTAASIIMREIEGKEVQVEDALSKAMQVLESIKAVKQKIEVLQRQKGQSRGG